MRFSLHFIATLLSIYITTSLFATDYVFIGNGDWNDPNNWEGGAVPLSNPGGSTITIKGTAINGLPFEQCPLVPYNGDYVIQCPEALYDNSGTIIIEVGGSLTLQNDTQFSNGGSFIVYGTLINKTTFEAYDIGNITIYGTFQNEGFIGNQGLITVNNGGSIDNRVTFDNDFVRAGQMIVNSGGIIKNSGSMNLVYATLSDGVVIDNTGTLVGTPTIDGSVNNSGTLSPGHSPGTYTINGNYTATNTAKHIFEVSGTTEGTYDALNVGGTVNLNGTLNVSFIDGYSPTTSDNIPIISGTIKGTFSTVNIPSQYALVYNSNSVVLKSVSLLPVNFISVNAKKESNGIKLSWNVADEYNVIRYEVEKSTNGISFERIGTVNAVHQSLYGFIDSQPETKNYYRIKSVDLDGKFKYSSIAAYYPDNALIGLKVYPAPVKNEMTVQHSIVSRNSKITIIAMDGKVMLTVLPKLNSQQTTIDVSGMMAGMYILKFENGKKVEAIKFAKQ